MASPQQVTQVVKCARRPAAYLENACVGIFPHIFIYPVGISARKQESNAPEQEVKYVFAGGVVGPEGVPNAVLRILCHRFG